MTEKTHFETTLEVNPNSLRDSAYMTVPFEVPPGTQVIELSCRVQGRARVDMGLCEGEPSARGALQFSLRGWSGSHRSRAVLGSDFATPGYLCGPIRPGRWSVLLGFPVVDGEARVKLDVEMKPDSSRSADWDIPVLATRRPGVASELERAREAVRTIPGVPIVAELPGHRAGLLCGDFHSHSWHSGDAETTLVEMVAAAEARKLDFLAVTDHNTTTHWAEIDAVQPFTQVTLVKGQEVTTYRGHFNAFLAGRLLDFRIENDDELQVVLAGDQDSDTLLSVNHPKHMGPSWRLECHRRFEAVEVWQAPWLWFNNESLRRWDEVLRSGRRIAGIGGSDVHDLRSIPAHQYGNPATWLYLAGAPKEPAAIVEAARRGRACITASPDSPIVLVEAGKSVAGGWRWEPAMGATVCEETPLRVRVLGNRRRIFARIVTEGGAQGEWVVPQGDFELAVPSALRSARWLRVELWGRGIYSAGPVDTGDSELVALTNPVYLQPD